MATFKTSAQAGNREILLDLVTYISRETTPFLSSLKKKKTSGTYTEWMTQALPTPTGDIANEGAAWSAGTVTARVRTGNYAQILRKCYTISRTQDKVDKAGVGSEVAEQRKLAFKDHARDIEYALLNGTGLSGTSRRLKGIRSWISTATTGSATGTQTLDEDMFIDNLQAIWDNNGRPTDTYVNAFQKRKINSFAGSEGSTATVNVNVDQASKTLTSMVSFYVSDFGVLKIHLHDLATTTEVLNLQQDMWEVAFFDGPNEGEVLPGAVDGTSFGIVSELTLISKNQLFSAKITELATS